MKIDFDEEKHEYSAGGVKIPSVSEILGRLSEDRYDGLNPWMLKAAAAKGTAVHEACELIDYGSEPEEDPETDGYLLAYQNFLLDHEVEWEMIEGIVYFCRVPGELPLYAGTLDRFGTVDCVPTLVDIKTYASLSSESQLAASCQTALYRDALESMDGWQRDKATRRAILHLKKDGTYRYIDLDEWDNKHGFNSRDTAWMMWNVWNNKDKALKTVRKGKKDGVHKDSQHFQA